MKILVTGSSSHLARVLLPILCDRKEISQVRGIDIKKCNFQHDKFVEHIVDVRDPGISEIMQDCDSVIHLAFVVLRSALKKERTNRDLIKDINVNGSINVFNNAAQQQVKQIIHISSAVVYGAWPENPDLINENQKRKVMTGFSYAEDKNKVEDYLDEFEKKNNINIVRLRPHVILGPKSQPFLLSLIKQPFYPNLPDPQPMSQCVWEDDVAEAIIQSLFINNSAIFNLAAEPPLSFKHMIKMSHKLSIPVPIKLLSFIHRNLWKVTGIGEEPGWLTGMPYSLAVDSSKAKKELNWKPKHTTHQCISMLSKKRN